MYICYTIACDIVTIEDAVSMPVFLSLFKSSPYRRLLWANNNYKRHIVSRTRLSSHFFPQPSYPREESNDEMHQIASVWLPFVLVPMSEKCTKRIFSIQSRVLYRWKRDREEIYERPWKSAEGRLSSSRLCHSIAPSHYNNTRVIV